MLHEILKSLSVNTIIPMINIPNTSPKSIFIHTLFAYHSMKTKNYFNYNLEKKKKQITLERIEPLREA